MAYHFVNFKILFLFQDLVLKSIDLERGRVKDEKLNLNKLLVTAHQTTTSHYNITCGNLSKKQQKSCISFFIIQEPLTRKGVLHNIVTKVTQILSSRSSHIYTNPKLLVTYAVSYTHLDVYKRQVQKM